jgi:hypothetical protein
MRQKCRKINTTVGPTQDAFREALGQPFKKQTFLHKKAAKLMTLN